MHQKRISNMTFLRRLICVFLCAVLPCGVFSACGAPDDVPVFSPEKTDDVPRVSSVPMRGVYIATVSNINFPSRPGLTKEEGEAELSALVDTCADIGFDTVVFQVRPSADALYASSLFPTSRFLTGEEGAPCAFDPLEFLCRVCEERGMRVVAWVNPYRVTTRAFETKEEALASLSDRNPARLHPDRTLFYDGRLYFDPGFDEVRELVADGVREICEQYPVVGVLFDDYFYPYPVAGEALEDVALSRAPRDPDPFRRQSVSALISKTHQAVKSVSEDLTFGVAPFGIWQNASSDPRGSATRGLEAYKSLYCDALAWIEEESVDYLAPQLYWERGTSAADFATLARWWADQVNGTGVGLVISYAAYKASEFSLGGTEIAEQMRFVDENIGNIGSIQYGFAYLCQNSAGVRDAVAAFYGKTDQEETGAV